MAERKNLEPRELGAWLYRHGVEQAGWPAAECIPVTTAEYAEDRITDRERVLALWSAPESSEDDDPTEYMWRRFRLGVAKGLKSARRREAER